jgi:hypothetical protein
MSIPAAAADEAMVRVLHGSPDAPAVDIYLDDAKVDSLTNVAFGTISDYLAIPSGAHNIKVVPTGGAVGDAVIDADVEFATGSKSTVAATNVVAEIEAQVLADDPVPTADGAQVRVVHFSADTPAVDVRADGGDAILTNLAYPDATAYLAIPGGDYDLEVCATGTDTCPLDVEPLSVANGRSYSVFAIGSLEGQSLTAVVAVDAVAAPHTDAIGDGPAPNGSVDLGRSGALLVVVGLALAGAAGLRRRPTRS